MSFAIDTNSTRSAFICGNATYPTLISPPNVVYSESCTSRALFTLLNSRSAKKNGIEKKIVTAKEYRHRDTDNGFKRDIILASVSRSLSSEVEQRSFFMAVSMQGRN